MPSESNASLEAGPAESENPSHSRRGVWVMIASGLSFSVMGMLVKISSATVPTQEIVLARSVVSTVLTLVQMRLMGVRLWGNSLGPLMLRGVLGYCGLVSVITALSRLPLAEAVILRYLYPVMTAALAAFVLHESAGVRLALSIAASLTGVVLLLKPAFLFGGFADRLDLLGVGAALTGAGLSAVTYVLIRRISVHEHPLVIMFYFPFLSIPISLPFVLAKHVMPTHFGWLVLLGIGVFTHLGQLTLTYGLKYLPAGQATAVSYVEVVFATFWGWLVFAETLDWGDLAGAACVWTGVYLIARRR